MAKKKMRSMLSQQREKLKAQKAAKAAKQAKAPKLPPGKKGGAIVKSKGSAITKSKGSAIVKSKGSALAKLAKKPTGKGSLLTAITTGAALGEAYRKTNRAKAVSGRGAGRATFNEKKKKMSNIPPKEGTGKGSPNDKKPTSGTKTPKTTSKPSTGVSRRPSASSKPSAKSAAYSKDARNKEYDRLRKAGKTKEAEALGKKIAADTRKKAPKNPFRAPQGAERKDRFSRDVAELKKMGSGSKKAPAKKPSVTRDTSKDMSRTQLKKYGSGSKKGVTRNTSLDKKKKKN